VSRLLARPASQVIEHRRTIPMPLHASWVHGNTVTIETPQSVRTLTPQGRGSSIDLHPGAATWLHIAIPTPVIVGDVRVRAQKFFLLLSTASDVKVTEVHIWDGLRRIHEETTTLWGNHSAISTINTFVPPGRHFAQLGTSISFLARATDANHGGHSFTVFSAGADFST
jgi:hypothetical protein